jgi:hypothetical protein
MRSVRAGRQGCLEEDAAEEFDCGDDGFGESLDHAEERGRVEAESGF